MTDDLTPGTERALAAAAIWAHRLGAPAIGPLHLMLGILDEPDGAAAAVLERSGLAIGKWREAYLSSPIPIEPDNRVLAPDAREAVQLARILARERAGERSVSTDWLALALLECERLLAEELTSFGLDVSELQRSVAMPPERVAPDEPLSFDDPVERIDAARILDANANRAREALRVLEDFCRFSGNDPHASRQIKEMRHALAEALDELPQSALLTARDTEHDVGTEISTERELTRHSLRDVVAVNLKRLQESLRSLEEYGKLYGSVLGQRLEKLRYRSYTLERSLVRGMNARERLADARLYVLLSGEACQGALDWTISEAAAGGVQIVQLREKNLEDRELIERARDVRRWTRQAGVLFIMNDRPDIARLVEADGVHLGQDDLLLRDARRIVGADLLIGVSTHNLEQVRQAIDDGADYIGVGPTFPSRTKDFDELAGLKFVREAMAATSLPAFVLGGVTPSKIGQVIGAGGRRVAVSAAIAQAIDPQSSANALRQALEAGE